MPKSIFVMTQDFDVADYGVYFEQDFRHRWLRPGILYDKLHKFQNRSPLNFAEIGKSVEDRPIYSITWGSGPVNILLWSQMHGNEPTATMAFMDLLNFLTASDKYDEWRKYLSEKISITLVPMLNPDGSERFTRQNALGVDLNRDCLKQSMPEMQVFMRLVKSLNPDWVFNLHDQRNIFSAGDTGFSATISFLSASADFSKKLTPTREKSMKLIGLLAELVGEHLPRHVGRYSDEFYPRALGDNFHAMEIPCVLIESGAFPEDEFRDQARKLNFLCMLKSFNVIASGIYKDLDTIKYNSIPENKTNFYDLLISDCELELEGQQFTMDIGLLYQEEIDNKEQVLKRRLIVKEIGDLRFNFGLREEKGGRIEIPGNQVIFEQPANFEVLRDTLPNLKFKNGKII